MADRTAMPEPFKANPMKTADPAPAVPATLRPEWGQEQSRTCDAMVRETVRQNPLNRSNQPRKAGSK
jgi:hypothetical protein